MPQGQTFVQKFGQSLTTQSEFGGMFHINGNHWIAAEVNLDTESISSGDPAGHTPEDDILSALCWFVGKHVAEITSEQLNEDIMPCSKQDFTRDWWQCGLFSFNTLAYHFLPKENPLLSTDHRRGDLGRLAMLRKTVNRFNETVRRF